MSFYPGNEPFSATEGELTNPAGNTLMADTGVLKAKKYGIRAVFTASAAASFVLQRRNAANSLNVGAATIVRVPANGSVEIVQVYRLEVGERLRVVTWDALAAGVAAVTIQTEAIL